MHAVVKPLPFALALVFALSGGAKLAGLEFEVQAFTRWGYPLWFMFATGAVEVAGALALLMPRLRALAAGGLAAMMVGAVATHVVHAEWAMLALAATILALSAGVAWRGRAEIAALVRPRAVLQA